jgi:hypothetical protein
MSNIHLVEQAIAKIEDKATSRQKEATKLLVAATQGDLRAKLALQEGISTSDIPTLLTPAINVIFLAQYAAQEKTWNQIANKYVVDNFGPIKFADFTIDPSSLLSGVGEEYIAGGLPKVGEYDEYPAVKYTATDLSKSLEGKHGVRARLSWETLSKVGNFDIIGQFTQKFAEYAAMQEDIALAKLFVTSAGAANAIWSGRNIVANATLGTTANPALSLPALDAALTQSRKARVNGNPVITSNYKLITGSGLATTVANLKSVTTTRRTVGADLLEINASVITSPFNPVMFPTLDLVSGSTTDKFWFVVPENAARAAFLEIFLSGAEVPLISVKDSGQFSLSGGAIPFREGSFDEDDIQTRVRHVVDAVPLELAGSVYSNGTAA